MGTPARDSVNSVINYLTPFAILLNSQKIGAETLRPYVRLLRVLLGYINFCAGLTTDRANCLS